MIEYSKNAIVGDRGRRLVEDQIRDNFGWLFREIKKDDLGIDAIVEQLDENNRSTGRLFAAQIKCGKSYLSEQVERGWVYRGDLDHLNYWTELSLPVLLILCDDTERICYWVTISFSSVEILESGWKIVVPFNQTLSGSDRGYLAHVFRSVQPADLIPLALYRLLCEKYRGIEIASELELPRDFYGFEFLARYHNDIKVIKYLYSPLERFSVDHVKRVLELREICGRACGWDFSGFWPDMVLVFVDHKVERLRLDSDVVEYMSHIKDMSYFFVQCDFGYGVSLAEIDENGEPIDLY